MRPIYPAAGAKIEVAEFNRLVVHKLEFAGATKVFRDVVSAVNFQRVSS